MIIIKSAGLIVIDPTSLSVSETVDGNGYVVACTTKDNRIMQVWPIREESSSDEKMARKIVGWIGNVIQQCFQHSPLDNVYIDVKKAELALKRTAESKVEHADT